MCGIAVAIDWPDAEAAVRTLVAGIVHRGDVTDPVLVPRADTAMGTRRLRIVDGEHALQPQLSFDGRLLVSLNGEIYNHEALRRELEAAGVRFRTRSDTEVLASALAVWGAQALHRLNGMYAFVALDLKSGEFIAARDPLGVKPLYVIQSGPSFLFCSEIRPLLRASEEGQVMFLPPGHLLTRNLCVQFKATVVDTAQANATHDPATLDRLLGDAVRIRIPPDLPFATMFSGGIDSTLVAHYAREVRPETPGYFLGDATAPDYAYAAEYADRTGLDFRRVGFHDGGDPAALIGEIVATAETFEPSVVRDALCTYLLSRRIHQDGFRVVLCGEGADELFAGYAPLEVAFADSAQSGGFVRDQCVGAMHRGNLQRLDRCAMRFQLEAREPFLDPGIVDYALGLDRSALVETVDGRPRGKAPLRSLYDRHGLPATIRDRRKVPLNEGSGFDLSQTRSPWVDLAEESVSDREFADGRRRFAAFDLRTKEEFLYLRELAQVMDVFRVVHLSDRMWLRMPPVKGAERLPAVAAH